MESTERFEKIYVQGKIASVTEIWIDKETGIKYMFHRDGNAAGLTPLLNKEGRAIVSER